MEIIEKLITEQQNEFSSDLDLMDSLSIVSLMNREDQMVAMAVEKEMSSIAHAVDVIVESFKKNGRLIYVGAGTSGRLGLLDASECPPTFSTESDRVIALMAGGQEAMFKAVEGAEDNHNAGIEDLLRIQLNSRDVVVGISASGRAPYVVEALRYAKDMGCQTIAVSCNIGTTIGELAHIPIEILTGPEVLSGSTRLKAGSAQKMVLNMLSTASMVRLGKAYTNLMIDLNPTNKKLVDRACGILMKTTNLSFEEALDLLKKAGLRTKVALIMARTGMSAIEAERRLQQEGGFVRKVFDAYEVESSGGYTIGKGK